MNFFRKNVKGSVCIFLTLLMLPVYSFALACTDGVKITAAERMANRAGELGLAAGISDYNNLLNKVYGLYAVSDIDASTGDMTECFEKSLPLKELNETYNNTIVFEKENISAEFPCYSVLANPDILKYQITEYCKYDCVSEALGEFISKFGSEKEIPDIKPEDNDNETELSTSDISEKEALDFFQRIIEKNEKFLKQSDYSDSEKSEIVKEQTESIENIFGETEKSVLTQIFTNDTDNDSDRKNEYEKYFYDSLKNAKYLFSFGDIEEIKDDFLLAEYILNNFSYITDEHIKREGSKIIFSENNNFLFGREAEYILCGNENTDKNTDEVKNRIFSVRFVFNCVYVFNSNTIRTVAKAAAAAAALATGVPDTVYEYLFLFSYAAAESAEDVSKLVKGEKVPLYKSKNVMNIKSPADNYEKEENISFNVELNYCNYIELFLMMALQSEKKERDILTRTASVIGINMKYALKDYKEDRESDFDITKAYTILELNAEVKTDTQLLGLFDKKSTGKEKVILVKKRKIF